jgi:2-polyprenyl-3-methyl-5-hydroxy-6-metoxy-1,4-benzoquinol methylase
MTDLFRDNAADWDSRPVPQQISEGVFRAIIEAVAFDPKDTVMDFGAGTGLIASKLAPRVGRVLAVDVSPAMLEQLAKKPEFEGKLAVRCQNIIDTPLDERADVIVSAMAMHHVEDTRALMRSLFEHLAPGGAIALADLDTEPGDFHPPGVEGVFHHGFDRAVLGAMITDAGFAGVAFTTACEVSKEAKRYPIFLVTATKPA